MGGPTSHQSESDFGVSRGRRYLMPWDADKAHLLRFDFGKAYQDLASLLC
jgi:hypothetical protein